MLMWIFPSSIRLISVFPHSSAAIVNSVFSICEEVGYFVSRLNDFLFVSITIRATKISFVRKREIHFRHMLRLPKPTFILYCVLLIVISEVVRLVFITTVLRTAERNSASLLKGDGSCSLWWFCWKG